MKRMTSKPVSDTIDTVNMTPTNQIELRQLGKIGPKVPQIGLGCVPLGGGAYGMAGSDEDRLKFLDGAYEIGARFWDCGV